MPGPSQEFIREAFAQDTKAVYLVCVKIDHPALAAIAAEHPDLESPIRVVNDYQDLVRADGTYKAWAFEYTEPDEGEDAKPRSQISLDNVDRRYIYALRSIDTPATVTVEIVLAHNPNVVERSFDEFELVVADWGRQQILLNIAFRDDDGEPACAWIYNPAVAPGIY
ncbi:DUF1833 family protein [Hyphobacterium sp.]|uniref:DUF1833 family protein n=1 Tax=Hyphobacterium sp. TaxID=2004662 RepID=UPI003BABF929